MNVKGSGFAAGALRLFTSNKEVKMKIRLRQVDHVFELPTADGDDWHLVTIQAGLLDAQLNLTFTIGGEAQTTLPAELIDGIRQALEYVRKTVRVRDLREKDPLESDR